MTTYEEAIAAGAVAIAQAYEELDTLPIEEQARRAYTPTEGTYEECLERVRAYRERQRQHHEARDKAGQ